MGAEPPAFRNACSRTQVPSSQIVPVSGRECNVTRMMLRTSRRLVQELQACQCVTERACHIEPIADSCAASQEGLAFGDGPDQCHTEKPPTARSRRISADQSYMVRAASGHHPPVQLMNLAVGTGAGNRQGHEQMLRRSTHRSDIAEIRRRRSGLLLLRGRSSALSIDRPVM
jgi:hypothetical protein